MRRILVVRTDRLGDVIMTTPMIRELRRTFPDSYIATLTNPATSAVFLHNPHVNAVLTDDLRKETFWQVVGTLRKHRFSDGLLVFPTERAAWQMFWGGIRRKVTVGHKFYAVITLMRGISRHNYIPLRHEADYCMDLARAIGISTTNIVPEIYLTDEERQNARAVMLAAGLDGGTPSVIVHTGTNGSSPNWSEQRYHDCIKQLLARFNSPAVSVLLTAREMTQSFRKETVALSPERVIDISERIGDLREFIGIIGAADVIITPSTGPAHIADALGGRAIGLHCHRPMNCVRYWGILNPRSINLEVPGEYCRAHCSTDQNACGIENGISTEQVLDGLANLLADTGRT
jgi:heptosyltransferase III